MKKMIISTLIILSGCATEKSESSLLNETTLNNADTISTNKMLKTLSPLSQSILNIEDEKIAKKEKMIEIKKIEFMAEDDPDAMIYLAALYEEGTLITQSENKARSLYKKAADKDHLLARYYYALMLIDGRGGDTNHTKAESYLLLNVKNKHDPSIYSLGYLYFIQKKYQHVINTLNQGDNGNNEYSDYLLAISYLELNNNTSQAIQLLEKSAKKDHPYSHLVLGDIYRRGLYNTEINTEKSFKHLNIAAKNDNPKALFDLATLSIENLELIENDLNIAINQLESADKNGYPPASFELAKLYDKGNLIKQDFNKAIFWYKRSAAQGNNRAMYNLASIYINGDGVDISIEKAKYWLIESAKNGNNRAKELLKENE
ncbi:tetratricopeptide repeat protein [Photobacterium toruni]|uniref:Localization factor PodJL n=1 Tax=Photobacterium toruni TaxID=1935446 RepID=A0A1T4UKH6_9GAMM|nr:SEL1-like repeat protein [Photobacterium toruni]MEC6813828.1 SEL1-like repeat protein [Photobacterium toruni]SKA53153.1 Localization factor PodJL [Photobacterium toruni]